MTTNDTGGLLQEAPGMGKTRGRIKNQGDPRGQFGAFLRDWIDRKHGGSPKPLAESLGVAVRTVQHWAGGAGGPAFEDLDRVAVALGMSDFAALALALRKFKSRR